MKTKKRKSKIEYTVKATFNSDNSGTVKDKLKRLTVKAYEKKNSHTLKARKSIFKIRSDKSHKNITKCTNYWTK